MKILIVNTLYYPYRYGGAEQSVQNLAESLVHLGFEVVVVAASEQTTLQTLNGVKVYHIRLANLYWQWHPGRKSKLKLALNSVWHTIDALNPIMAHRFAKILDLEKPDIVHTNNILGFSVLIWDVIKRRKIPLIHTLRDYYLICPKTLMFDRKTNQCCKTQCTVCRIYATPKPSLSERVDHVVGISEFILNQHRDYQFFPSASESVIPNSCPVPAALPSLPRRFSHIRFGFAGRIDPSKGLETLLSTIVQSSSNCWSLSIAGNLDSAHAQHLTSTYTYASNLHFLGYVPIQQLLQQIDVLVVPSLWQEPFGRIVIEAFTYGIPVIATTRGGLPELIQPGITGYLFDPDHPAELAQALDRFIAHPEIAQQMRAACLKAAERFSNPIVTHQYTELYQHLTGVKSQSLTALK